MPSVCYLNHSFTNVYQPPERVLFNYLNVEDFVYNWQFLGSSAADGLTISNYHLTSQIWPKNDIEQLGGNLWQHKLVLYIPDQITHATALIFVNGGYNINKDQSFTSPMEKLNFTNIALQNNALVVDLQDVPNQYLKFSDGKLRKEDEILAFSYKKVLNSPEQNAFWAGHLPMAKAVIKAMDAVQEIAKETYDAEVSDFVVAGASKRAWATWLVAIADQRVSAIIPIALDILNVQKNIEHIYQSYNKNYPLALRDYQQSGVLDQLFSANMDYLMTVEDPFSYIHNSQMSMPKYIINNSGDDFYVPDSSHLYFARLPGTNNYLSYLPNSPHYYNNTLVSEAIGSFFKLFLSCQILPQITWKMGENIEVSSSMMPHKAILWFAHNPDKNDFRYNKYPDGGGNIRYQALELEPSAALNITVPIVEKGWLAAFVTLEYDLGGTMFGLSSEVEIFN